MKKKTEQRLLILGLILGGIGALAGLIYLVDLGLSKDSPQYQEHAIHLSANTSFSLRPIYLQDN